MVKPFENQKSQKNRPSGSHGYYLFHLCSWGFGFIVSDCAAVFVELI